jgi:hypothetical protein
MLPVLQMDLKILHRHARAGGVELAGAVVTPDSGEVLELDVGRWGLAGLEGAVGEGLVGEDVDGGVAHCALEAVVAVGGAEGGEAGG